MARKSKKNKSRLRIMLFGSFCLLLVAVILGSLSKSWISIYEKYNEKEELSNSLTKLRIREEQLSTDVAKLKDPEYIARFLREKYFYSTNGEYIIRIPK